MLSVTLRRPLDRFELDVSIETSCRVTGLFGASGAGKSTTLACIAGLARAEGRVAFGEETWLDSERGVWVPPERRRIGYVPQDGLLFPHLDVAGNLRAGVADRRVPDPVFELVCERLNLGPLLERDTASLSGGERQRVALGRALCSDPKLLLLDEPLASLDLPLRRRVLPFLRRIRDDFDVPMVLVSHEPTEVLALCDRLVVLSEGRCTTQGEPSEVLADPRLWGLGEQEELENIFFGTRTRDEEHSSVVDVGGGIELDVPRIARPGQFPVLVTIPAQQVLVAARHPVGLSARNLLPATVSAVREAGDLRLVSMTLGDDLPALVAEVTPSSCAELGLSPGRSVVAVVKTTGCRVLACA